MATSLTVRSVPCVTTVTPLSSHATTPQPLFPAFRASTLTTTPAPTAPLSTVRGSLAQTLQTPKAVQLTTSSTQQTAPFAAAPTPWRLLAPQTLTKRPAFLVPSSTAATSVRTVRLFRAIG